MTMHQGILAGLVLLLGGSLLAGPLTPLPNGESESGQRRQQAVRPNIIFVLTDDLDRNLGTLDQIPRLKEMLAGHRFGQKGDKDRCAAPSARSSPAP